jgi:toxin ParE1/3/4
MIPYTIAPLAQNDLDGIWSYIARDSLAAADRLIALFHQKFLLLSSQPLIGEERPELAANLRSFSKVRTLPVSPLVSSAHLSPCPVLPR